MFALSVALKYLLPRRRQLSVAVIGMISVAVISLVVWLILVFFSVSLGLERHWIGRFTTMTGQLRIIPTESYRNSYYAQIDSYCEATGYSPLSIAQKRTAEKSDPYDPEIDAELPENFPPPSLTASGDLCDPVKELFLAIDRVAANHPGLRSGDYVRAPAYVSFDFVRENGAPVQIANSVIIANYDPSNPYLEGVKSDTPTLKSSEEWVVLPKNYRDSGIHTGIRGTLTYHSPTSTSLQEQRVPIAVAGFYDPGLLPFGGKLLLTDHSLAETLHGAIPTESLGQFGEGFGNGVQLYIDQPGEVDAIQKELIEALKSRGVADEWQVESFRDFEFTRDFLQQLQSDKHLFLLIAGLIMVVACSNIISMLIILVNDKKREIGIYRAMGASTSTVAAIFGGCGMLIGACGSVIGIALALFTLRHLDGLVTFLSSIQGHQMFNPLFYGKTLPNALSTEALIFTLLLTMALSLISGLIPAVKACRLNPSTVLRGGE
ncbi:MAG: ABC transporter permease [Chlamydiia bacterium]|nr:ABC transporter permease [Chlamydiia bacterium]